MAGTTNCARASRSYVPSDHHKQICHCTHEGLTFLLHVRSVSLFPQLFFISTKTESKARAKCAPHSMSGQGISLQSSLVLFL